MNYRYLLLLALTFPTACKTRENTANTDQAQVSLASAKVWLGTAPFCKATPESCAAISMDYVRSDKSGDGTRCWTGEKVLCKSANITVDAQANELTVVNYNVFLRDYAAGHDGQDERSKLIPAKVAQLNAGNVDIVVHEELFVKKAKEQMDILYANLGFAFATDVIAGKLANAGVAIYSRWPFVKSSTYVFKSCVHSDCLAPKGVIYVKVQKSVAGVSKTYHILAAHLQAWNTAEAISVRRDQLREFKTFKDSLNIPLDEPVIYAGDFNINLYHKEEYPRMIETLQAVEMDLPDGAATYDPSMSELIGRDGSANDLGCAKEYNQTKFCSCCPIEFLDYVLLDKEHLQPSAISPVSILPIKNETSFKFCASAPLQPFNVGPDSKTCKKSWETKDLSDHALLMRTFVFDK